MKTSYNVLDGLLQAEVHSLTTLWEVTRRDGQVFRFTEHDDDIEYQIDIDPDVEQVDTCQVVTFRAASGYSRTSVRNNSDLAVDNLDITSLIDPQGMFVTERDIRAGKWDFAEVRMWLINWEVPQYGALRERRGRLGEISLRDDIYVAELRGLVQLLQQNIGEVYTPACRADLTDSRCKVDRASITDNTFVDADIVGTTSFSVPDHFIGTTPLILETDWRYLQGVRLNTTLDPNIGRLTLIRRLGTGTGQPGNPYIVSSDADLDAMRDDPLAWYALANDIDMTSFGLWTPIPPFRGGLDGRGFKIQNLDLDHSGSPLSTHVGLFEELSEGAHIRRVYIEDATVNAGTGSKFKGPLAGFVNEDVIMEDCITDCITAGGVATSGSNAGGFVGAIDPVSDVIMRRCLTFVPITGTIGTNVGGQIGAIDNNLVFHPLIHHNYFDSTVAGTSSLGTFVRPGESIPLTTSEFQDPANFVNGRSNDDDTLFDMLGIWEQAVASTSRPNLRRWY